MSVNVEDVRLRIADLLRISEERVALTTVLTDLVVESFKLVEMAIELQEEYDVILGQADLSVLKTVGDLAQLVQSRVVSPGGETRELP